MKAAGRPTASATRRRAGRDDAIFREAFSNVPIATKRTSKQHRGILARTESPDCIMDLTLSARGPVPEPVHEHHNDDHYHAAAKRLQAGARGRQSRRHVHKAQQERKQQQLRTRQAAAATVAGVMAAGVLMLWSLHR